MDFNTPIGKMGINQMVFIPRDLIESRPAVMPLKLPAALKAPGFISYITTSAVVGKCRKGSPYCWVSWKGGITGAGLPVHAAVKSKIATRNRGRVLVFIR